MNIIFEKLGSPGLKGLYQRETGQPMKMYHYFKDDLLVFLPSIIILRMLLVTLLYPTRKYIMLPL